MWYRIYFYRKRSNGTDKRNYFLVKKLRQSIADESILPTKYYVPYTNFYKSKYINYNIWLRFK